MHILHPISNELCCYDHGLVLEDNGRICLFLLTKLNIDITLFLFKLFHIFFKEKTKLLHKL